MDQSPVNPSTAPSVTFAEVKAAIVDESYTVLPNGRTTVCQLTLDNGFTVEGQSACVSIENFDPVKGNKYAYDRALDEVWKLLGFRLADKIVADAQMKPVTSIFPVVEATPDTVGNVGEPYKWPELGDQVLFYEQVGDKESAAMVGIVSAVLGNDYVGLTVLAPNGTVHARDKVLVVNPWMTKPADPYYCRPKN